MGENTKNEKSYDDMIELSHHVSASHPHMAISDRAAQFSPFAALTGHEAAIRETARLTSHRVELDENRKEMLNEKLLLVMGTLEKQPVLTIVYFEPDRIKDGGSYITINGIVKKVDTYNNQLILLDGTLIPITDIIEISEEDCSFFTEL